MNELVRFLLSCIEADEALAKKAGRQRARQGAVVPTGELMSPERVRAECHAKREAIGALQQLCLLRDLPLEKPVRDAALHMLEAMAAPYADHAGYRAQWGTATRYPQLGLLEGLGG